MHRIRYIFEDSRWKGDAQSWWTDAITYIPRVGEMVHFPFATFYVEKVAHHVRPLSVLQSTRMNSEYDSKYVYISVDLGVLKTLHDGEDLHELLNGGLQKMGWERLGA